MRVFQAHQVKHPLHSAVFARRPVERVEHDIGADCGKHLRDVTVHIDADGFMAQPLARIGNARATCQ